ncbi:uncharacterized protein LOC126743971 [Anthonomus grandis grandis]|uniref:uncharacterized protein LOC126743971 n=1 Tax=Anthonomus grandis grandis TaxID=2921223 RepID=UPI0021657B25|nr:uncharacterized protein LOC126743971 [Anthonomus grandis grandis]
MRRSVIFLSVGILFGATGLVESATSYGLTVEGVKCGQKTCKLTEYCSSFHTTCESCADICDANDNAECEKLCQDYLHDLRYVRKDDSGENGDLRGTVKNLSRMVTVTLSLVIFMLLVLACLLSFQLYRWKVKKNITLAGIKNKLFKKNSPATNPDPNDNKRRDLRLEMPSPTVNSEHSPVTVSTSIGRRPAEDSTLDYAYDNPAMSKTPNSSR